MDLKHIAAEAREAFDMHKGRAKYSTIRDRILGSARLDGIHMFQLIAAMLIASIGLNTNSTEAVIGAMLICPLMGSVLAMAYAVASIDMHVLRHAVGGILLQCGICLVTSTLYFLLSPLSNETSELLTNSTATIWDVLIALVGGFAGALGLSRRQEPQTLLAGVAVATALMPPLCSVGYGLSLGDFVHAGTSLYEFLINVLFIGFGATIVLVVLKIPIKGDLDGDGRVTSEELAEANRETPVLRRGLVIGLLLFALPCFYFSGQIVRTSVAENGTVFEARDSYDTEKITQELEIVCPGFRSYHIGTEDSYNAQSDSLTRRVVATVETASELDAQQQATAEQLIRLHAEGIDEVTFEVAGQ